MPIWIRTLFTAAIIASLVTAGAEEVVRKEIVRAGTPNLEQLKIHPRTTIIYGKNNQVIAKFYNGNIIRDTSFSKIPKEIVNATLATEDRQFYQESGVDVRGILRSAWADLLHGGQAVQGGSTITQQLIKNVYLSPQKNLQRKITEAIYATDIEQKISKNKILQNYFDHIFYGENAYGVSEAVQTYFGVSLAKFEKESPMIRIARSALIAGLPQAPTAYNPYYHPNMALKRRNVVLHNMWVDHKISKTVYQTALKEPLLILKNPKIAQTSNQVTYKDYVQYVLHEASVLLKETPQQVMASGMHIYTAFNPTIEQDLLTHYAQASYFPPNAANGNPVQSASVFLNPKNGEITALVGSRNPDQSLYNLNRAYQTYRQTGSSIKPILEYGAALQSGKYNMYSLVNDIYGTNFGTKAHPYIVHDDDYGSRGWVPMIQALQNSYNISAVWMLQQIGIPTAVNFLKKLGINLTNQENQDGLAMAIGGLSRGVTVLQMAQAYQIYANGGYFIPAHAIIEIKSQKNILYKANETPTRIVSANVAAQMRWMLHAVVTGGTGVNANVPGQMVSGKTGTTSKNEDLWFVGFTKNYVGAVWMGFDTPNAPGHTIYQMSYVPAKLFGALIAPLLKIHPDPSSNYSLPPIANGIPSIPGTPQNVIANTVTPNSVTLDWNPLNNASLYIVKRNGVIVYQGVQTSFTDQTVVPNQNYTYQIYATNNQGNGSVATIQVSTNPKNVTKTVYGN